MSHQKKAVRMSFYGYYRTETKEVEESRTDWNWVFGNSNWDGRNGNGNETKRRKKRTRWKS
jgi:hypothetical protein